MAGQDLILHKKVNFLKNLIIFTIEMGDTMGKWEKFEEKTSVTGFIGE